MTDPKIDLKTPWVAGVLAYLLPGAGHLYQGRFFKGVLFFVCIFGTFLYGMSLGEWRAVFCTKNPGRDKFGSPGERNYGYLAQLGIGGPVLYAYAQSRRYRTAGNRPVVVKQPGMDELGRLNEMIDAEFRGKIEGALLEPRYEGNIVAGRIHLEPHNLGFRGKFTGTITDKNGVAEKITYELGSSLFVDSRILGDSRRKVRAGVIENGQPSGELNGSIPRGFFNWFEAPLDDAILQDLHGRLGKRFEMSLVYTWIAGFLNILVIWDAVQGPAYGYDDERKKQKQKAAKAPKDADAPEGPTETPRQNKAPDVPSEKLTAEKTPSETSAETLEN